MYIFLSHEGHQVTRRLFCPGGDRFVFSVPFVGDIFEFMKRLGLFVQTTRREASITLSRNNVDLLKLGFGAPT